MELRQGLCEHLVPPGFGWAKGKSTLRVRRVQPSLPCAERQQHLLSLPALRTPCQGTPKNQPMDTLSLSEWITVQKNSRCLNSSCLFLSGIAACLPVPQQLLPRFPRVHHHPQDSSAVRAMPWGDSQESQQMAFPEHTELCTQELQAAMG